MIQEVLSKHGFEPELLRELETIGSLRKVQSGDYVVDSSRNEKVIPFVLQGLLKVYKYRSDGSKVLLYYLEKGETCSQSIACCLEKRSEKIQVIAEEDSQIWMLPNTNLDQWVVKYPSFRRFVFSSYQHRFDELMDTIDSLVFTNMEDRLYKYLLDTKQAMAALEIHKTHQQIADELSTSRVVISRLLKKLEHEEKIAQHRNRIEIL